MTYAAVVRPPPRTTLARTRSSLQHRITLRRCYLLLALVALQFPVGGLATDATALFEFVTASATTTSFPLTPCGTSEDAQECMHIAPHKMNWEDAHAYCRRLNGFLPSSNQKGNLQGLGITLTWTALAPYNGHYQWLSSCAAPARFVKWEEKPKLWSRECSAFNVTSDKFLLQECSRLLNFVCVVPQVSEEAGIDYNDVELRVSGKATDRHGWITVALDDLETLQCVAFKKSTGERLEPQPDVFWNKDGVYYGHCADGLQLATVHGSFLPGATESDRPILLSQGTVWCETWVPRSTSRISSNKVLVTLKDFLVLIFNAHVEEAPGTSVEEAKESLRRAFQPMFINISNYLLAPISIVKRDSFDGSTVFANYSFHLHIPKTDLNFQRMSRFRTNIPTYNDIYKNASYLETSNVAFPIFCLNHEQVLADGRKVEWPFAEVGFVHPLNRKCRVKYGKLKPGLCMWNYTHGAHMEFEPSECTWTELCPEGYHTIHRNFCVQISKPDSWDNGFSEMYKTGLENSILDKIYFMQKFRGKDPVYNVVRRLLNESGVGDRVWLPIRRKRRLSPLRYMGPNKTEFTLMPRRKIKWQEGHPRSGDECLAVDTKANLLLTSSCDEHLPFASVIESSFIEYNISMWYPLITESPSCDLGWNSTIFKGKVETCFKLFKSNKSLSWSEANLFCDRFRAQLPTPNVGFLDWVYRQYLFINNVSDVWMGVEWRNERFLFNGSVENLNWISETDYSQPYGVLTQSGWQLGRDNEGKHDILCQKITTPQVPMKLQVHEPLTAVSQTMCIDANPPRLLATSASVNPRCFVNGEFIRPEQTDDSGCQYELKLSSQGYYQCQAWTRSPFSVVESNVILHRDLETFTYVVTFVQDKPYNPHRHDSSFFQRRRSSKPSETCAEAYMDFLGSSNLSDIFRFTNKNFFYLPSSSDSKLLYNFHLECELKNPNNNTLTDENVLKILKKLLEGKTYSDCKFMYLRSTQGCSREISRNSSQNLTWPSTTGNGVVLPEELCITPDGKPVTRECLGDFVEGYYWGPPTNICSGTPSFTTQELWKISSNPHAFIELNESSVLVNLTANSSALQPIDIHFIASTLDAFSKDESYFNYDLGNIVAVMNNVMGANETVFEPVQKILNSSCTILEAFEQLTFKVELPKEKGDQALNSSGKYLSVERLDLEVNSSIIGYKSLQLASGKQRLETLRRGFKEDDLGDVEAAIIFPDNLTITVAGGIDETMPLTSEDEKVQVTFAVYRNVKLFQENITNYTVNSHVIQATYRGQTVKDLHYPIKILFRPLKTGKDTKCVYWDFAKHDGKGGWSGDGCRPGERQGEHDVCLCNHLTCFAQLINYDEDSEFSEPHAIILNIITIIGCCLSIVGLLLVFTTFFLFKKWRRSLSNKILVNLCFSVFCSIVIFLAGINQTWNVTLCRGVAVSLHYFILASFGWMLVEAVHQYLKFVKVVGTYIPRFLWKASVCAWGIPVFPILAVLVIDSSLYDNNADMNSKVLICWMSVSAFKYAFLPPLVLTMTVNLIMFSLIIHGAVCGRARVNSTMSERTLFMNQLRMAVCVFFLLGFTWIFGLLAVKEAREVFSYLFCIFNTLQGFFLFLFHVCRERSARRMWRDFLSVLTKDPVSSSPGNSFNPAHSINHRGHPDSVSFDKCGGILVLPRGPPLRSHLRSSHTRTSLLSARTASTILPSRASINP